MFVLAQVVTVTPFTQCFTWKHKTRWKKICIYREVLRNWNRCSMHVRPEVGDITVWAIYMTTVSRWADYLAWKVNASLLTAEIVQSAHFVESGVTSAFPLKTPAYIWFDTAMVKQPFIKTPLWGSFSKVHDLGLLKCHFHVNQRLNSNNTFVVHPKTVGV